MQAIKLGFGAAVLAAVLALSSLELSHGAQADDRAEPAITRTQYDDINRIEPPGGETAPAAMPVTVHKLNDAEKAEMDRMHAVRVVRGRDWRELTPEERYERIKNLRDTMPGVSLMLTVPGGDLWAVPPGEEGVNFQDIVKGKLVRFWTLEEIEHLPATVGSTSGNNWRSGRDDAQLVGRAPQRRRD